jgi:hypothetical protein
VGSPGRHHDPSGLQARLESLGGGGPAVCEPLRYVATCAALGEDPTSPMFSKARRGREILANLLRSYCTTSVTFIKPRSVI